MACQPVAGVWSRLFEEDPLGDADNADRTTLVLWTQTPSGFYVDLRLPKDSPGRSSSSSTTASTNASAEIPKTPSALRAVVQKNDSNDNSKLKQDVSRLAQQKSFAGVLEYSLGDTTESKEALAKDKILAEHANNPKAALALCTCFWRRDIDYQPPSGGLDIGVCASYSEQAADGSVDLRETGDDGSYAEGWHRLPGTFRGPFMALTLVSENDQERTGFWVQTGHRFAYAIGRPASAAAAKSLNCPPISATIQDQVGKTLAQVVQSMAEESDEEKVAVLNSYVGLAGEIDKDGKWRILDSTNPLLVGCLLVGPDLETEKHNCSVLKGAKDAKVGDVLDQIIAGEGSFVRKWKIMELSGCVPPYLS